MVFSRQKLAVFIDGCFWHSCPTHTTVPRANREWWIEKLAKNAHRDRETDANLEALGWTSLRFWEHEDPAEVVNAIELAVRGQSSP